nr:MAG TPA: hypothetical protein [Caudoviricetes sp.]
MSNCGYKFKDVNMNNIFLESGGGASAPLNSLADVCG